MVTQDDVIYFVATDRFCSSDPGNDFNADPQNPECFHGGDFFDSAGYHGYWAVDFERVDPHLYSEQPQRIQGSRAYFRDLVTAFHDAGLKVILDMVVNHTGYPTPAYEAYPQ